jgi:hypothetical protein
VNVAEDRDDERDHRREDQDRAQTEVHASPFRT